MPPSDLAALYSKRAWATPKLSNRRTGNFHSRELVALADCCPLSGLDTVRRKSRVHKLVRAFEHDSLHFITNSPVFLGTSKRGSARAAFDREVTSSLLTFKDVQPTRSVDGKANTD